MHPHLRGLLAAVLLPLTLAGCRGEAAEPEGDVEAVITPHVVEIIGMDYAFQAPLTIPSGWTTFNFHDHGPEPHHMTLVRLENGHSLDDLLHALQEGRSHSGIATALGGPNAPGPGGESNATMNLAPGEYALICFIPSPDGVPHFAKGMVKPITVTDESSGAAEPEADLEITMHDFSYELSGEFERGTRTIRVTTDPGAAEPHDIALVRLEPGKTMEDFGRWMHTMEGPPPGAFLGGMTVLDPGQSAYFTVDFEPGDHLMACPVESADGQPHLAKGMIHTFNIE